MDEKLASLPLFKPLFKQVIGVLWLSLDIVTFLSLLSYGPGYEKRDGHGAMMAVRPGN